MSNLGVIVGSRLAAASRGIPTDTGTSFVVGKADGPGDPLTPVKCRSLGDAIESIGDRETANQKLYDCLDGYFKEGGSTAWVSTYQPSGSDTIDDALLSFGSELGPGQVWQTDETNNATIFGKLQNHAADNNRVALLDVTSNATVGSMTTLGGTVPTSHIEYGALFGPWVKIPAPAGVVGGSQRTIPASPIIAALCSRVDALGNPNRAAAGRDFPLQYVEDFALTGITMAQRTALLDAGVNTMGEFYGVLENYGFQTTVDQDPNNPFWQFNCVRGRMWLLAQSRQVGENYVFKPIDGKGHLAASLKTDLDAVCLQLYNADGLYGETPGDAFAVTTGTAINTTTSIAQGEMHAEVQAVFSEHAKAVFVDLVTIPIGTKPS